MCEYTKRINRFLKVATKKDIREIKENITMSEQLEKVFDMFYLEQRSIDYIAYKTGYSVSKINSDLKLIRNKIKALSLC